MQCPYKLLESLEDVCREDSKIVGNVLDKILKKKYPEIDVKELECDWVTLEVILDWTVWPCYLQLLTSDPGSMIYYLLYKLQEPYSSKNRVGLNKYFNPKHLRLRFVIHLL